MPDASDGLTSEEATAVLRRAAELDEAAGEWTRGDLLDVSSVEQAALEVGVPREAVRQALAELRVGALAPTSSQSGAAAHRTGAQRVVELEPRQAGARITRVLRRQLFELRRSDDMRQLWRRRTDMGASLQRTVNFSGRIKLKQVQALSVSLSPVADDEQHRTLIRIEADLGQLRNASLATGLAPGAATFGLGGGAAALAGEPIAMAVAGAGGLVLAAGGLRLAGAWFRSQQREIAELLDWLLDQISR